MAIRELSTKAGPIDLCAVDVDGTMTVSPQCPSTGPPPWREKAQQQFEVFARSTA